MHETSGRPGPGPGPNPGPGPDSPRSKSVRIDTGSAQGADIAPGRGSLLRAFGAWGSRSDASSGLDARAAAVAAAVRDRRAAPRHEQIECLAWLGWKTWRRFHMNDALVINLSRGGAQIFVDAPPPNDRPVWVFLETPGQNMIVKARVVELRPTGQGQCAVRVEFTEPCSLAFFDAAVCGLAAANPKMRAASSMRVMPARTTA